MTLFEEMAFDRSQGLGQFHVVVDGELFLTLRSFESAKAAAEKRGGQVYNDSDELVFG